MRNMLDVQYSECKQFILTVNHLILLIVVVNSLISVPQRRAQADGHVSTPTGIDEGVV